MDSLKYRLNLGDYLYTAIEPRLHFLYSPERQLARTPMGNPEAFTPAAAVDTLCTPTESSVAAQRRPG